MNTGEAVRFFALPNCPHLTRSACGYSLLALDGLPVEISSSEIARITINCVEQKFRAMGDKAVMLIPDIDLEAQTIKIYRHPVPEVFKPFKPVQAGVVPPPMIAGLQPPQSHSKRCL